MNEIWKDIEGYEGYYQISNMGRVRSLDHEVLQKHKGGGYAKRTYKGRIMTPSPNGSGRMHVILSKSGKHGCIIIHRLVAKYFVPNPNGYNVVNHINANPYDNRAANLEWCTQSHNIQCAYDMGTKISPLKRRVAQYDLDGNLLNIYESVTDATKAIPGTYRATIANVCNGKYKQAGGFRWEYA